MKSIGRRVATLVVVAWLGSLTAAWAQGPTVGSINGTVTDSSGAVMPGVTVTTTSQAQMGVQTSITNEKGQYRFPAVAPGEYRLAFELSGFGKVIREGIRVSIGFTAEINVQMQVASMRETVTVSGTSPVVDTQNTNVQNTFRTELLNSLPNARDIWSLMAEAPGMTVTRFDVGGSTAGTQTGFSAYGQSTANRVQMDGVNTTEGTGAAGFYMDYGAFEEIQLGVDSNDASMPVPGVAFNGLLKSGGNQFRGQMYLDYENQRLQARRVINGVPTAGNVTDALLRRGAGQGVLMLKYYDPNGNFGGPIKKDKVWFFVSLRDQDIVTTVTGFPYENPSTAAPFETQLTNATYKLTYQITQKNKLSHYIQYGRKVQPIRNAQSTYFSDAVYFQDSGSWAGNVEWSSTVSPTFFMTARASSFGYNWPNMAYGTQPGTIGVTNGEVGVDVDYRRTETSRGTTAGGYPNYRYDRRRWTGEWTGTLYRGSFLGASHSIRTGWLSEWEQFEDEEFGPKNSMQLTFNSPTGTPDFTKPYRVTIYNRPFTSRDEQWHHGVYVTDQLQFGRGITVNAGVRMDYYNTGYPDQALRDGPWTAFFYRGAALSNGYSFAVTPWANGTVPSKRGIVKYPHAFGPRLGLAWDVRHDGKTVVKANWGRYKTNPGTASDQINPLQSASATFDWVDSNGDNLFQPNEFGTFRSGGAPGTFSVKYDPNIGHPYTDDVSVAVERQLLPDLGFRAAYVYKMSRLGYVNIEQVRVGSLYTAQKTAFDPGPDGLTGTPDDRGNFTFWDTATAFPGASFTIRSTSPENYTNYKNIDLTLTKRMSHRWSLVANALHTSTFTHSLDQTPNGPRNNPTQTSIWTVKFFGTYQAPWGFVVTPQMLNQKGSPLSRTVTGVSTTNGAANFVVEKTGSYRGDTIHLLSMRVERRVRFGRREFAPFVDVANLFSVSEAQNQDGNTGRSTVKLPTGETVEYQRFLRPTTMVAPRVFRFGFKVSF